VDDPSIGLEVDYQVVSQYGDKELKVRVVVPDLRYYKDYENEVMFSDKQLKWLD